MYNGRYAKPGTLETINSKIATHILEFHRDELRISINEATDGMIKEIPNFLDDYYSLKGEYKRLFALTLDELETELTDKLNTTLGKQSHFDRIERLLNGIEEANHLIQLETEIIQEVELFSSNEIFISPETTPVVQSECEQLPCFDFKQFYEQSKIKTEVRLKVYFPVEHLH